MSRCLSLRNRRFYSMQRVASILDSVAYEPLVTSLLKFTDFFLRFLRQLFRGGDKNKRMRTVIELDRCDRDRLVTQIARFK